MTTNDIEKELQELWDWQACRIDTLAALPEAQPQRINTAQKGTWRHRLMVKYLALGLVSLAAGITALAALGGDAILRIQITGYVLGAVNAFIAVNSLVTFAMLLRHHPAKEGTDSMSRFVHRMNMEPRYSGQQSAVSAQQSVDSRIILNSQLSILNSPLVPIRQVAAVSAAALVVLVSVACTPIGDGHAMSTGDRAARAEAIHNVETILSQI